MQLEFWTRFKEHCESLESELRLRKPYPRHWYDMRFGTSRAHISLIVDTRNEQIRCELYIPDDKDLYATLKADQEAIEKDLSYPLEWMELPERKASRIVAVSDQAVNEPETWTECFSWLSQAAQAFQTVFGGRIRS